MIDALILFAQEEAPKQPEQPGWANPIFLLPIIFFIFYFVVILPQQRKQKREQEALFTGMKKNDKVMTAGGIIGVISFIEEGKMRVLKSSIVRILSPKDETKDGAVPAPATTNTGIKPTA